jgi:hypothetical protein
MQELIVQQKADPWEPPCQILGLPAEKYFEIEAASSHLLSTMVRQSPLHAKTEKPPTKAKDLGSLFHLLVLEPHRVATDVAVKPADAGRGSNAAKKVLVDWALDLLQCNPPETTPGLALGKALDEMLAVLEPRIAENEALFVVGQGMMNDAQRMRDSLMGKSIGRAIFEDGEPEVTMLAIDPATGVLCRIRVDWMPTGHWLQVDLKSAANVCYDEFGRAAGKYNYHIQAAFYRHVEALVSRQMRKKFLHVVVENVPPYDSAFYEIDEDSLAAGTRRYEQALRLYARCMELGKFPGVGYDWGSDDYRIESLQIQKWAL